MTTISDHDFICNMNAIILKIHHLRIALAFIQK